MAWFDNVTMTVMEESEELLKNHSFTDLGEHWLASNPSYDGDACIFSSAPLFVSQSVDSAGPGTYTLKVDVTTQPLQNGRIVVLADGAEVHSRDYNGPGEYESTFPVAADVTKIEVRLMRTATGTTEFKFNSVSLKRSG